MKDKTFTFAGFVAAGTTWVPDIVFDELLPILSGAELKALLYIIRRTLGFNKDCDSISLSQFKDGITTKDGKQLDKGCGVSDRTTLVQALNKLEEYGCINRVKSYTTQRDKDITLYSLRYVEGSREILPPSSENILEGSRENRLGVVGKSYYGSRENRLGVVGKSYLQETVIQNTDSQLNSNTTNKAAVTAANQTRRGKNTNKKKLLSLEAFDLKQAATSEVIMQLGDIWRGSTLPVSNRADSDYTKAETAAATLSQRLRGNNTRGYSLEEINAAYKFFKRIGEPGQVIAEDWWKGKNVDLWVIAKNIDKALDKLGAASYSQPAPDLDETEEEDKQVLICTDRRIKAIDCRKFWFLYEWISAAEATQKYGEYSELPSNYRNDIANRLECQPEEAARLAQEYRQNSAALVSA